VDTKPHSDAWIPPELLVPWSSRVSFSSSVCGLPGRKCGCWRWRQLESKVRFTEQRDQAISPSIARDVHNRWYRWLVFHIGLQHDDLQFVVCSRTADLDRQRELKERHSIIFGFTDSDLLQRPTSIECRAWVESAKNHFEIEDWTLDGGEGAEHAVPSLYDCFGGRLFDPVEIEALGPGTRIAIADLIGRHLDNQCSKFRRHVRDLQFGVSWCHLEVQLLLRWSAEPNDMQAEGPEDGREWRSRPYLLSDYGISFSDVDPATRKLRDLDVPRFGGLEFNQGSSRSGTLEAGRSLVVGLRSRQADAALTYADCLAPEHRHQILPSELDSSYLSFTHEEIAAYLLFWLLALVLGSEDPDNAGCIAALVTLIESDDPFPAFATLLVAKLHLPWEGEVLKRPSLDASDTEVDAGLGVFRSPVPFGQALTLAGLDHGGEALVRVAEFLLREFHPAGSQPGSLGFRRLPMYEKLGWQACAELVQLGVAPHLLVGEERDRLLVLVLRSLGGALIQGHRDSPGALRDLARQLPRASVFPFARVLDQWPRAAAVRRYFIFPIWESIIDGRNCPSIFAHVFSCRPAAGRKEVEAEGKYLQEQLLLFGRFIAQSYYDRQLQEIHAQRQIAAAAYNIGHPLKRRVDVLRASLTSLLDLEDEEGRIEPVRLTARVRAVGDHAKRVSNLGHILNVLSDRLTKATHAGIFLRKAEWHATEPYRFAQGLTRLQTMPMPIGMPRVEIRGNGGDLLARYAIACRTDAETGRSFRPADMFYDEMLFEAFTNAAKHGVATEGVVEVECSVESLALAAGAHSAVVFRNRCAGEPRPERSEAASATWCRWKVDDRAAVGGLFFIANLLTELDLGAVWTQAQRREQGWAFALALSLNGLNEVPHDEAR
jgi:hypothetical protein